MLGTPQDFADLTKALHDRGACYAACMNIDAAATAAGAVQCMPQRSIKH
jgi:hypothetical protein